jgi:hypothetical protein
MSCIILVTSELALRLQKTLLFPYRTNTSEPFAAYARISILYPLLPQGRMKLRILASTEFLRSHYEFPHIIILPFVEDQEREEETASDGKARGTRIHPAHQNIYESMDQMVNLY